ncbi:class I SAM-dependent methyltransferase [Staphylococcus caeli]|uniref:class I SAM-dependent methyltransferase n=1 Tax=Staphylococcus caeli TaxID=2201815 RepID=UPI003F54B416
MTSNTNNILIIEIGRLAIIEHSDNPDLMNTFLIGVGEKFNIQKNKNYFIKPLVHNTCFNLSKNYNLELVNEKFVQNLFINIDDYYFGYEERYKKVYDNGADLWETGRPNESLLRVFYKYPDIFKGKVIDLGCGEGRDTIFLYQQNINIQGIDISHSAIEKAKEKIANANGKTSIFSTGNVLYLNQHDKDSFDLAMNMGCLHMMYKCEDRSSHLKNVSRILKTGGYFLVDHCNSEWGKGFHTIENYSQIKDKLKNFSQDNYIDRAIVVNGKRNKIPLKVIPYSEKTKKELIKEITFWEFEFIEAFESNTESFGNSSLILFRKQ